MGTTVKSKIREELRNGIRASNPKEAQQWFRSAHAQSQPFARLHMCCHAALFANAIVQKKWRMAARECWLMSAAIPVTLRRRLIRTVRQSSA